MSVSLTIALIVLSQLILTLILRMFPDFLGSALTKSVEHRFDLKLEKAKAEMQSAYSTLKTSVDFISVGHPEYRQRTLGSVESLWTAIGTASKEFSNLLRIHRCLESDEIDTLLNGQEIYKAVQGTRQGFLDDVRCYGDAVYINQKLQNIQAIASESNRLFVGDKLWLRYMSILSVYLRSGVLMNKSIKEARYMDWRRDDRILKCIDRSLLPGESKLAKEEEDLGSVLARLEDAFLKEARRVMSGSEALAEALSDVQASMQIEHEKISEARERFS
jgi:hypothetical protein